MKPLCADHHSNAVLSCGTVYVLSQVFFSAGEVLKVINLNLADVTVLEAIGGVLHHRITACAEKETNFSDSEKRRE